MITPRLCSHRDTAVGRRNKWPIQSVGRTRRAWKRKAWVEAQGVGEKERVCWVGLLRGRCVHGLPPGRTKASHIATPRDTLSGAKTVVHGSALAPSRFIVRRICSHMRNERGSSAERTRKERVRAGSWRTQAGRGREEAVPAYQKGKGWHHQEDGEDGERRPDQPAGANLIAVVEAVRDAADQGQHAEEKDGVQDPQWDKDVLRGVQRH